MLRFYLSILVTPPLNLLVQQSFIIGVVSIFNRETETGNYRFRAATKKPSDKIGNRSSR